MRCLNFFIFVFTKVSSATNLGLRPDFYNTFLCLDFIAYFPNLPEKMSNFPFFNKENPHKIISRFLFLIP